MARPLRVNHAGGWYHVMNRGIERRVIFHDDRDREHFLSLVGLLFEKFGLETHAYCLMENHYSLAVRTPLANLSKAMKWLGQLYCSWYNRRHNRVGPLFQGRFKSLPIDDGKWVWQLSIHIHLNPIFTSSFGLIKAEDRVVTFSRDEVNSHFRRLLLYRWSSFRAYLGYVRPPKWLQTSHILGVFGEEPKEQQIQYQELVEGQLRVGVQDTNFERFNEQIALGSNKFVEKIKETIEAKDVRELQGKRRFKTYISFDKAVESVEKMKGESKDAWLRRHGDWGKWMLLLIGHRYCGLTQAELGQRVGGMDYAAVSAGVRKLEKRVTLDKALNEQLQTCINNLSISS